MGLGRIFSSALTRGSKALKNGFKSVNMGKEVELFGANKSLQTVAIGSNGRTFTHQVRNGDKDVTGPVMGTFAAIFLLPLIFAHKQCSNNYGMGDNPTPAIIEQNDNKDRENEEKSCEFITPSEQEENNSWKALPNELTKIEFGDTLIFKSKADSIAYEDKAKKSLEIWSEADEKYLKLWSEADQKYLDKWSQIDKEYLKKWSQADEKYTRLYAEAEEKGDKALMEKILEEEEAVKSTIYEEEDKLKRELYAEEDSVKSKIFKEENIAKQVSYDMDEQNRTEHCAEVRKNRL